MALKFLTLMNPNRKKRMARRRSHRMPRRSASGRFVKTKAVSHRRTSRRRRVYHNPPVVASRRRRSIRRSSPPKMTPAMRRKISLAVKRSIRARAGGGGSRAIAHRRPSRISRFRGAVARRFSRRSVSRRSSFGSSSIVGSFKSAFNKPTLMKAGGAVLASIATGFILKKYGSKLPMASSKYGKAVYSIAIPITAAYFVQRKNRELAEGLVIGGLVMGITEIIRVSNIGGGALGNYAPYNRQLANNNFGVAGELGMGAYPVGDDLDTLGAPVQTDAFPVEAW